MSKKNENSEIKARNFLQKKYQKYIYQISEAASFDSTKPDLEIVTVPRKKIILEVKKSKAQGNQFVLHPDIEKREFTYSQFRPSIFEDSKCANIIKDFMSKDFDTYNPENGAKARKLPLPPNVSDNFYAKAFIEFSKIKNISFFIIQRTADDFIICPVSRISFYCKIGATWRKKTSGSRTPSRCLLCKIQSQIEQYDLKLKKEHEKNYIIGTLKEIANVFPNLERATRPKNSHKFMIDNHLILLTEVSASKFKIRELSKTENWNVIFSVELCRNINQDENDLEAFKASLIE